jgi:hypothetical protein
VERPVLVQELAFELVPMLGAGATGQHAVVGPFGEALAGLRWRQFAAVHLGIGGGSLGGERHVLLLSAVPQFRPLPVELPVDVAIGLPFGYVTYAHKAGALVGGEPMLTTATEHGFHVGGLLAALVEASPSLAFGPVLQFDRFFAPEGASFFSAALAGRYSRWFVSGGP